MTEGGSGPVLAIVGGSGVYDMPGLTDTRWEWVGSSFGEPSDELFFGELDGQPLVFLPRHGRGHRIPPTDLNFRANIDALKRAGVTEITGRVRDKVALVGDDVIMTGVRAYERRDDLRARRNGGETEREKQGAEHPASIVIV